MGGRVPSWLLGVVTVVLVGAAPMPAQAAAKKQIAALEDEWIKGLVRRDARTFERLLASDFLYTEDSTVTTRAQLIKDLTSGTDTVTSGRNEDLTVRAHDNVGVATGWLVLEGRGASGSFRRRYRYTDTWIRTGGRWRVLAAQDYLVH